MLCKVTHALGFLKARLSEGSTRASIIAGITGAAILPYPWGIVVAVLATVFAMIPDAKEKAVVSSPEAPSNP